MAPGRCEWAQSPLMIEYHDREWGVPVHDDRHLFEHLVLEGAQAGLSWELILRKREGYRRAFSDFDIAKVAAFGEDKVAELLQDPGIVRNRQKVRSAITNAQAAIRVQEEHGSLDAFFWGLGNGEPRQNAWRALSDLPPKTPESERISKELVRSGFKFVGPTGIYAFMQSVGMVNDHVASCFRYSQIKAMAARGGARVRK